MLNIKSIIRLILNCAG